MLDWIVPSPRGDDAPLAAAALAEANARASRSGAVLADETLVTSTPLPGRTPRTALQLRVADGPAWYGYIGLSFDASFAAEVTPPQGLVGYLALIETVPANDDGSQAARELVRTLIGPLPLDGLGRHEPVNHLRATRVPATPYPERLRTVGWVETDKGRVLAAARAGVVDCARRK